MTCSSSLNSCSIVRFRLRLEFWAQELSNGVFITIVRRLENRQPDMASQTDGTTSDTILNKKEQLGDVQTVEMEVFPKHDVFSTFSPFLSVHFRKMSYRHHTTDWCHKTHPFCSHADTQKDRKGICRRAKACDNRDPLRSKYTHTIQQSCRTRTEPLRPTMAETGSTTMWPTMHLHKTPPPPSWVSLNNHPSRTTMTTARLWRMIKSP